MKCGFCGARMVHEIDGEVELDRCTRCGAWFFDRGELAAVLGDERIERSVAVANRVPAGVGSFCGRCGHGLRLVMVADPDGRSSRARIAVCRGCEGLLVSHEALERARSEGLRGVHTEAPLRTVGARTERVRTLLGRVFSL